MDESHEDGEQPLHYYYNREERLKNAPKPVRDYYEGRAPHVEMNIVKALTANPVNRFALITLLGVSVLIFVLSRSAEKPYRKAVGGTEMTLSAFSYEDEVYVTLKAADWDTKSGKKKEQLAGMLSVTYSAIDNQKAAVSSVQKAELYKGEELAIRTKFSDYDILAVKAEVSLNGEKKELTAAVEKR